MRAAESSEALILSLSKDEGRGSELRWRVLFLGNKYPHPNPLPAGGRGT